MRETASPAFGELLRRHRLHAGLTQEDLAGRAGLSTRGVVYLERGSRLPYRDTIRRLSQALELMPAEQEVLAAAARSRGPAVVSALASSTSDAMVTCFVPRQAPDSGLDPLPLPATTLVGREQEVAAVTALLLRDEAWLVTLTGPGGVGKTRLALQTALQLRGHFADGVAFISLAPVGEAGLVLPTVAQALGVIDQGNQPLSITLAGFLRQKHLLMVLDNFEQVLSAAGEVATLRAAGPGLRVLATSRAALRVQGERVHRVPPLAAPTMHQIPAVDVLAQIPAVKLFVQRAQAIQEEFALTAASAAAVASICVQLDGLPLALELAAAWVHVLPLAALAAQLAQPLQVLTHGAQDLPVRQQTLRETIAWSYRLLVPEVQALFRRLAVFAGNITPAAAAAVCLEDEPSSEASMLEGLRTLVDLNLLHQAPAPLDADPRIEPRFTMLATIRAFGREQLQVSGELEPLRRRHMDYYLSLVEEAIPHLWQAEQLVWLDRLDENLGNLRLALAYGVERSQAGDADACARCLTVAGRLSLFWLLRSYIHEALLWLEQLLRTPPAAARTAARAWALWSAGPLTGVTGDHALAHAEAEECVAIFRELGDPWALAAGLDVLACVRSFHHRPNSADLSGVRPCRDEALQLFRQAGDPDGVTTTMIGALYLWSGIASVQIGDLEGARADLTHGLALIQATGERFFANLALESLARLARAHGDLAGARGYLGQALVGAEALGDHYSVTRILCTLGTVAQLVGDLHEAQEYYRETLRGVAHLGHVYVCELALSGLAELALALGDPGHALRLVSAGIALAAAAGATPGAEAHARLATIESSARQALSGQEQAHAWTAGQGMTLEQIQAEELVSGTDTMGHISPREM